MQLLEIDLYEATNRLRQIQPHKQGILVNSLTDL